MRVRTTKAKASHVNTSAVWFELTSRGTLLYEILLDRSFISRGRPVEVDGPDGRAVLLKQLINKPLEQRSEKSRRRTLPAAGNIIMTREPVVADPRKVIR